jgi:hypothetical protein
MLRESELQKVIQDGGKSPRRAAPTGASDVLLKKHQRPTVREAANAADVESRLRSKRRL